MEYAHLDEWDMVSFYGSKKMIQLLGRTGLQAKGVPGVLAEGLMIQLVKNQLVYPLVI